MINLMKLFLSSIDTSGRPLHEQRWIKLSRLTKTSVDWAEAPGPPQTPSRYFIQSPCCCDDPACDKTMAIRVWERHDQSAYVAPEHHIIQPDHLDASPYARSIGDDGWTAQALFLDHLGRPAYGLSHPARRELEEMLKCLSKTAKIEEPSLMITPAEGFGLVPYVTPYIHAITLSVELLDYFADRIEILDSILGHEIAHILQYDQDGIFTGAEAELEADCVGARLAGHRREKWALEYLREFLVDMGMGFSENDLTECEDGRYYPLKDRIAAINQATSSLPLALSCELTQPSLSIL